MGIMMRRILFLAQWVGNFIKKKKVVQGRATWFAFEI
jgi:hypothetical protein